MKKEEKIAYHEAGHAIAHIVLNIPFPEVTIIQGDGALGHVGVSPLPKKLIDNIGKAEVSAVVRCLMEDDLIAKFAGREAIRELGNCHGKRYRYNAGADGDIQSISEIVSRMFPSQNLRLAYCRYLSLRAYTIVKENWELVETIARSLLRVKTMMEKDVRAALDGL